MEEVFAARDEFGSISFAHKSTYAEGAVDAIEWKPTFISAMRRGDAAIEAFKDGVLLSERRYATSAAPSA